MPTPKNPNTSAATVASVAARQRAKYEKWAMQMRAAGWTVHAPGELADFDTAVDWAVNRCLDLDQETTFRALADGLVTVDELDNLHMDEIRARLDKHSEGGS